MHDTFNVIDLSPFVGTNEDKDDVDLRTNPFQGGGDDGRGPSSTSHERQEPSQERLEPRREHPKANQERLRQREERLGPITRSMAKRIHEDLDQATDGRESYLYMLHVGPSRVT